MQQPGALAGGALAWGLPSSPDLTERMAPVSLLTKAGPRGKALLHAALRRGCHLPLEVNPGPGS